MNLFESPVGEKKLRELIRMIGVAPRELLRTNEAAYRELNMSDPALTDDEIIARMAERPELIQRPIVVRGRRAVLGRPTEKIKVLVEGG